ncbi:MAG: peptidylprolyl isomerase [Rhodothermaceae bacterium]|nr:peptidylprolyl isomerase [Rhodothermaceae bacterium]
MRTFRPALLLLAVFIGFSGCTPTEVIVPEVVPTPPALFGRAGDGLLERPDLQAIVDLQVLRRGDELVELLSSPDAAARARAAFALGSVQHESAVGALVGHLRDTDARVRADVVFALGQTADSTVAPALFDAYAEETDTEVQRELLEALGKTGGHPALRRLLALSVPPTLEPTWAMAVARFGIRGIHNADAVTRLALQLSAPSADLREAAAYYFGRVRETAPWAEAAPRVRASFARMAPGDPAKMHLVLAIGRLQASSDVGLLISTLSSDPDWRIRTNAARALGSFDLTERSLGDALFNALVDSSPHVAVTAAGVLAGKDLTPEQTNRVAQWIDAHPDDWQTAGALLPSLVRAGRTEAVRDWLDAQNNPFAEAQALTALGSADDPATLDHLFDAAEDDDTRAAYAAVQALKRRWSTTRASSGPDAERYFEAFVTALRRNDLATSSAAAPVLADSLFAPFSHGAVLREAYAGMEVPLDVEPMTEVIKAIGEIRDGEEVNFLVDVMMQSGHPVLREAAAEALNGRLIEGIDVEARGGVTLPSTILMEWDQLIDLGRHPLLTLVTERGMIVVELDTEQAPQTVQKIARTVLRGEYDGVPFHRVVPNFVLQGGDFYREDGFGGPEVAIRSEFTRLRYRTGTIGMASSGKDTEGVQYFVTHSPTPHLDGRYTAFGRVVAGQDVADAIRQGDEVIEAIITPMSER